MSDWTCDRTHREVFRCSYHRVSRDFIIVIIVLIVIYEILKTVSGWHTCHVLVKWCKLPKWGKLPSLWSYAKTRWIASLYQNLIRFWPLHHSRHYLYVIFFWIIRVKLSKVLTKYFPKLFFSEGNTFFFRFLSIKQFFFRCLFTRRECSIV